MITRESDLLPLLLSSFCIIFQLALMRWVFWNYPLNHGCNFFMGVEVAPGFYEGPGIQWLRRYRALLLAVHAIMVFVFVALVASHRWKDLPIMVTLLLTMVGGFTLWTRRRLASNPPKLPSVAISLETRRLTDYVSWRVEVVLITMLAASWLLLILQADAETKWVWPVLITYAVMGLLPAKIIIAHDQFPLPPDRAEEHKRWQEAGRRYWLKVTQLMRWFLVVRLAGYSTEHGLPAVKTTVSLHWFFFSALYCRFVGHVACSDSGQRSPRCRRPELTSDRQLVKPVPSSGANVNRLVELVYWLCSRSRFIVCTVRKLITKRSTTLGEVSQSPGTFTRETGRCEANA